MIFGISFIISPKSEIVFVLESEMMNWKKFYDEKISTPEEAIKDIHDGDCVVMGHAAAAPKIIQHAMAEHCEDYNDVLIFHMTTLGDNECLHPRCYGHFRHVSNFLAANSRDAVNHAREGKSILAMPSTAANGTISRIKPFLTPGSAVSTTRNDVNYIVTEYGIARLKGRTLKHRAEDLIRIAHPDFRPALIEEYERRFMCKYEENL